ncbi:MAG: hypothetical protein KC423_08785 [Anaerolineales bacterium]|nr:hypothetical protein [Anaerolineales bacterium]
MSTEPLSKTKFHYTSIPSTAQYKWSNWEGRQATNPSSTLEAAKAHAESDSSVSYFFHMKSGMVLEQLEGRPSKYFYSGDAVFFSGEHLWLGSAPGMSDTYLVAELYDTSDVSTANSILKQLRDGMLLGSKFVDTSTGTASAPKTVTIGFVFCNFQDVPSGDINSLKSKLMGPQNASGETRLEEFISRESNRRVKLNIETYGGATPKWVTLKDNHTVYAEATATDRYVTDAFFAEVDQQIEFPDNWDVVMFAFPDTGSEAYKQSTLWSSRSHCANGQTVDVDSSGKGQNISRILLAPKSYTEAEPHAVTIHELMHALGLPDLYFGDTNRSYGWSIMSAMGAGTHITGFEKLVLGWNDMDDYYFLKRGMLPAESLVAQSMPGKKGIIILPDDNAKREDIYYIEQAQQIGVGVTNRANFEAANKDGYGLLVMILRKDKADGRVIPFVSERPADAPTSEPLYGGASKAPFKKTGNFSTNGIFSYPAYYTSPASGGGMGRIIGVNGTYTPPSQAKLLRENDRIALDDQVFMMTTTGLLSFGNNSPCLDAKGDPVGAPNLWHKEYGYVAYVDKMGVFHVAAALDDKPTPDAILKTFALPPNTALSQGNYYFKLEKTTDGTSVGVYKEGVAGRQYTLFRKPQIIRGWESSSGRCTIRLQGDGNLLILVDGGFRTGSIQKFGYGKGQPAGIIFDANGQMTWLDGWGKVLKTFSGTTGVSPFTLAVSDPQANNGSLVVVDANQTTLYKVFDY